MRKRLGIACAIASLATGVLPVFNAAAQDSGGAQVTVTIEVARTLTVTSGEDGVVVATNGRGYTVDIDGQPLASANDPTNGDLVPLPAGTVQAVNVIPRY